MASLSTADLKIMAKVCSGTINHRILCRAMIDNGFIYGTDESVIFKAPIEAEGLGKRFISLDGIKAVIKRTKGNRAEILESDLESDKDYRYPDLRGFFIGSPHKISNNEIEAFIESVQSSNLKVVEFSSQNGILVCAHHGDNFQRNTTSTYTQFIYGKGLEKTAETLGGKPIGFVTDRILMFKNIQFDSIAFSRTGTPSLRLYNSISGHQAIVCCCKIRYRHPKFSW